VESIFAVAISREGIETRFAPFAIPRRKLSFERLAFFEAA
jgi:hypothetical protein